MQSFLQTPPCIGRDENGRNQTKGTSAYTKDLIYMILCVVAHCISSPGLVHKITSSLQALNEQRANKDKEKPLVVAANDYLVTEALTYMADLYPSHLLLAGKGNAKKMVPVKQMAPINKDEATMSVSIKNTMEEYNLIDAPVRNLRPYVSVLDGQSWTGQSASDFFTQTSTLVK